MTDKFLVTVDDIEKLDEEEKKHHITLTVNKGGAGSGHWGHAGRPGKIGGSLPASIALSVRTGRTARSRQREAKFDAAVSTGKYKKVDEYHNEGVTHSQRLILEDHGKVIMKAIDDEVGHNGLNAEVDMYEISQELGWDVVPETEVVILDKDVGDMKMGQPVSIQSWINDSKLISEFDRPDDRIDKRSYSRIKLLDYLSGNVDRHEANLVIDNTGKCWAIDNNRAFWDRYQASDVLHINDWTTRFVFFGGIKFHPSDVNAVMNMVNDIDFRSNIGNTYGLMVVNDITERMLDFEESYNNDNYGVLE